MQLDQWSLAQVAGWVAPFIVDMPDFVPATLFGFLLDRFAGAPQHSPMNDVFL